MINFNDKYIPSKERKDIVAMFNELLFIDSYYSQLQFLYNNNQHYTTVSAEKNLCDYQTLYAIAKIACYDANPIIVHGTIHNNNHSSNLLVNQKEESLFVEDTYIRISAWNNPYVFMHILMMPPKITVPRDTKIFFKFSNLCEKVKRIIPPIISYIDVTTQFESGAKCVLRPASSHILQITKPILQKIEMLQKASSPKAASPKSSPKASSHKSSSHKSSSPKASPKSASPKASKTESKRNSRKRRSRNKTKSNVKL